MCPSSDSRTENWPELADVSTVVGCAVYVYGGRALVELPDEDECDPFFDEAELRALAAELIWAADRLAAR